MTDIMTGVVVDANDHQGTLVVDMAPMLGKPVSLVVLPGDSIVRASVLGALAHGDRVTIGYERNTVADTNGAVGIVRKLSILNYEAVIGHAA